MRIIGLEAICIRIFYTSTHYYTLLKEDLVYKYIVLLLQLSRKGYLKRSVIITFPFI